MNYCFCNACLLSICFNSTTNIGCFLKLSVKAINGQVPGFYYGNHIISSRGGSDLGSEAWSELLLFIRVNNHPTNFLKPGPNHQLTCIILQVLTIRTWSDDEIMGRKSSDIVRFDFGPLLQDQKRIAKLKSA